MEHAPNVMIGRGLVGMARIVSGRPDQTALLMLFFIALRDVIRVGRS
jgi:hypothetical protein